MEQTADAMAVRHFLAFLRLEGVDPRALGLPGLEAALDATPGSVQVAARLVSETMQRGGEITGDPALILRFAEWVDLYGFGPASLLSDHCATLRQFWRLNTRFSAVVNTALMLTLDLMGEEAALAVDIHPSLRPRAQRYLEGIMVYNVRALRAFFGERWAPERVCLSHADAGAGALFARYLRCPMAWNAERCAVIVRASDLDRRVVEGRQQTVRFLEAHLAERRGRMPIQLRDQVEAAIAAQLAGGGASIARVAALSGMSVATLQRRLARAGTSYGELLAFVRTQIVREHLAGSDTPSLARLAHRLGFSEPSAACRFIRRQFGAPLGALTQTLPGARADMRRHG